MGDMYKEPEQTEEYWIGVWDTLVSIANEPNGAWVLDTNMAEACMVRIPDVMSDELRELGRADLADKAEEIANNGKDIIA